MLDIDRIKSDLAHALRRGCSERSCTLTLQRLGKHVVLNGEKILQDRQDRRSPMCDCIIFVTDGSIIVGIVELKSKTADPGQIERKLTNSSRIALDIVERYTDSRMKIRFYHLVLCKRWRPIEYRAITSKRIKVRGSEERYSIIARRCGIAFSTVIS